MNDITHFSIFDKITGKSVRTYWKVKPTIKFLIYKIETFSDE